MSPVTGCMERGLGRNLEREIVLFGCRRSLGGACACRGPRVSKNCARAGPICIQRQVFWISVGKMTSPRSWDTFNGSLHAIRALWSLAVFRTNNGRVQNTEDEVNGHKDLPMSACTLEENLHLLRHDRVHVRQHLHAQGSQLLHM
jgi:hypothetical protein